MLHLVYLLKN